MERDKRGLEDIIKSDNANGFQTPETESKDPDALVTETQPEIKKRDYPSREGKKPVQFHISKDAHRQLNIAGAEMELTTQNIMVAALNSWFIKHDLPPIA